MASEPLLFVGFKSKTADAPEAMFVNAPPSVANAVTVKFVTPFAGSDATNQVTKLFTFVPDADALTNVKPDAN